MTRPLTDMEAKVLLDLHHLNFQRYPVPWARPLDLGGRSRANTSRLLSQMAGLGYVQFKFRGTRDPEPGANGVRPADRVRGAKVYRITRQGIGHLVHLRLLEDNL